MLFNVGKTLAGEHLNRGPSWSKSTEPRQHGGYWGNWKGGEYLLWFGYLNLSIYISSLYGEGQ